MENPTKSSFGMGGSVDKKQRQKVRGSSQQVEGLYTTKKGPTHFLAVGIYRILIANSMCKINFLHQELRFPKKTNVFS